MKSKEKFLKRMNVLSVIMLLLMVVVPLGSIGASASAYSSSSTTIAKDVKVKLSEATCTLTIGMSKVLKASVTPLNAKNKIGVWTSSNKRIVTVSSKGEIKGIKKGKAVITVTIKGTNAKATCAVSVQPQVSKDPIETKNGADDGSSVKEPSENNNSETSSNGSNVSTQEEEKSGASYLKKSVVASQANQYLSIDKVGTYNKEIITDNLKAKVSTLPEASNASIPYWTGFACENKIFKNFKDGRWDRSTDGSTYFYEQQIKFIADEGFNCARVLYSLSFLSNPENILEVNIGELEQLDELISWGMKYNVHIMLSFIGLPGKAGTSIEEENVGRNDELFTNPKLADIVKQYDTMLARRYADIPNRNLSFELLAEPAVPNGNLDTYANVLTPIAKSMWEASPGRVLIVNDVYKQVPERMAELGCSLSLHNHIYTVDSRRLPDISYQPSWPMEYLPSYMTPSSKPLTLQSETQYDTGSIGIYLEQGNVQIMADGNKLLLNNNGKKGWVEASFPKGTKSIEITAPESDVRFSAIKIKSGTNKEITLVIHDLYTCADYEEMPKILIKDNGTTQNIDNPQKVINADYFKATYFQKFIDCAKKYNVGFLLTEVGTDTGDLSKEAYTAYEGVWLKALKDNHIPWMYNCLHAILAPEGSFGIESAYKAGFTEVEPIEGTPLVKNKGAVDLLKAFR